MSAGPSAPRPRATLADIPPYVPGRRPPELPGRTTYKLSSNENPYPPLPGVLEAATEAAAVMHRYPDMGCSALYEAVADHWQVPPGRLAAGTGSVSLLYQLLTAFCDPGDEVVYAWRSFEAYPGAIAAAGARGVPVPVTVDGRHDLAGMAAAVTDRTRVVLVCTPNNPTGPAVTQRAVEEFLALVPPDVLVVLDEAYREFVRMDDPVQGVSTVLARENVAAVRTFSKAYGLAGLRVGCAVAPEPVAAALRAVSLPFGVSHVAQQAAVASLAAEEALLDRVAALCTERDRVVAALAEVGWPVPEPQGNFVWLALGERTGEFAAACEEAGVVVRPFAGEGVRVTVGEAEANDRVVEVAARFAAG